MKKQCKLWVIDVKKEWCHRGSAWIVWQCKNHKKSAKKMKTLNVEHTWRWRIQSRTKWRKLKEGKRERGLWKGKKNNAHRISTFLCFAFLGWNVEQCALSIQTFRVCYSCEEEVVLIYKFGQKIWTEEKEEKRKRILENLKSASLWGNEKLNFQYRNWTKQGKRKIHGQICLTLVWNVSKRLHHTKLNTW